MRKGFAGAAMLAGFIFMVLVTANSCRHDPVDLSGFDTVCFERDILPIFQNSCAIQGCHAAGHERAFNTYDGIRREVTPGNPAQSSLYQRITATLLQPMPPEQALAEPDRIRIRLWIEQGAKNTACQGEPKSKQVTEGGER